jgi:parvulin-like peptidyl-prolyl isomerase
MRACAPALCLCLALAAAAQPVGAEPSMANGIVAVVDGNPITLAQLRKRAAPHVSNLRRSGMASWAQPDAIRKVWAEVLDVMIDDALFEQAAAHDHIKISDKEVDEQLDRVAASQQLTRDALLGKVLAAGMTMSEYREDLRRQILAWRVLWLDFSRTESRPFPEGEEGSKTLTAYRKRWLAERRRCACVETWLASSPR